MKRSGKDLLELAGLFLYLGTIGFGGPPAHLAFFEHEVVEKRQWITPEELVAMIGAANLIPGPNSTEVAFSIGLRRAGLPGMIVSGICFIIPAALITGLIGYLYVRFGSLPQMSPFLAATKAAVIGIIAGSAARLARPAAKTPLLAILGLAAVVASVLGAPEVAILLLGGALAAGMVRPKTGGPVSVLLMTAKVWAAGVAGSVAAPVTLVALFLFFVHVGATIYGGGFVLASYLDGGLVRELHWLTPAQLLDAITVGQVTPGPVFTTATFVGYVIAGPAGAAVATVGIFLPCFFLVPAMHQLIDWAAARPRVKAFLDGVTVAAVGLIVAVAIKLAPESITSLPAALLAAIAFAATLWRVNPGVVVLILGSAGWLIHLA